ncbi:hypothetical protein Tco_0040074 [Tanacetum coccineum]
MDDPNITMEEYIRLKEEKARRHGRTFNWQTATFGKVENYEEEDDCFIDFEIEFPAIVFDNTTLPSEPTICLPTKTRDSGNDNDNMPLSPNPTIDYFDDLDYFKDFKNEFPAIVYNDGLTSKSDLEIKPISEKENDDNDIDIIQSSKGNEITPGANGFSETNMAPLPAADQRHPWLRYQVEGYTEGIIHSYEQRLETVGSRNHTSLHITNHESN